MWSGGPLRKRAVQSRVLQNPQEGLQDAKIGPWSGGRKKPLISALLLVRGKYPGYVKPHLASGFLLVRASCGYPDLGPIAPPKFSIWAMGVLAIWLRRLGSGDGEEVKCQFKSRF